MTLTFTPMAKILSPVNLTQLSACLHAASKEADATERIHTKKPSSYMLDVNTSCCADHCTTVLPDMALEYLQ